MCRVRRGVGLRHHRGWAIGVFVPRKSGAPCLGGLAPNQDPSEKGIEKEGSPTGELLLRSGVLTMVLPMVLARDESVEPSGCGQMWDSTCACFDETNDETTETASTRRQARPVDAGDPVVQSTVRR